VEEAARVLAKHPHTVREWIKGGLPTVDKGRPALIRGRDLRAYLEARRASRRRPCPPGTLYCFTCREPRPPALGEADFRPRDHGAGNLSALCGTCGRIMNRRVNPARIGEVLPGIEVRIIAGAAPHSGVR
jgi:hypothetical protein